MRPDKLRDRVPHPVPPRTTAAAKRTGAVATIAAGQGTRPRCAWCAGALPPRRRRFCSDDHRRRGQKAERITEDEPYGRAVVRMIGGMGRRASADLYALRALADAVDNARQILALAVDGCRARGYSDSEIGASLGITRQAVGQRFGRKRDVHAETAGTGGAA